MPNARFDYWRECIAEAADSCKLTMTTEQLDELASSVESSHENYGMAFHQPESPYPSEIKRLQKDLSDERSKRTCPECKGRGSIISYGPCHSAISPCSKCNGQGRVL